MALLSALARVLFGSLRYSPSFSLTLNIEEKKLQRLVLIYTRGQSQKSVSRIHPDLAIQNIPT